MVIVKGTAAGPRLTLCGPGVAPRYTSLNTRLMGDTLKLGVLMASGSVTDPRKRVPPLPATVTVTEYEPAVELPGVPLNTPPVLIDMPLGRPVAVQTSGALHPLPVKATGV